MMKMMVYCYRDFDEAEALKICETELGVECETSPAYPTLDDFRALRGRGFDIVSVNPTDLGRPYIELLHEAGVRYIATRSIGYDHIDLAAAREFGIRVCNCGYPPTGVADYTIMLILMCCRRIKHIFQRSAVQDYSLRGKLGRDIAHSTVGIIGTGSIGSTVAKRLRGFGCRIIASSPQVNAELTDFVEYVSLDELCRRADIITLHARSNAETRHMIGREQFAIMRPDALLINTARGDLVDTEALVEAIETEQIAGAALDVIENEFGLYYLNLMGQPLKDRTLAALESFPNVIITPHTAFYTDVNTVEMMRTSTEGCLLAEKGEKSAYQVV